MVASGKLGLGLCLAASLLSSAHAFAAPKDLGLKLQPAKDGLGRAQVVAVEPNSPAAQAGLAPGDFILTALKGISRSSIADQAAWELWVRQQAPGQRFQVTYQKGGDGPVRQITLGNPLLSPPAAGAPAPVDVRAAAARPAPPRTATSNAAVAPPPAAPHHAFCGGFDPGFRVFYVSTPTETIQPEATLEQRWGARLRARHELAKPSGVFCLVTKDAALLASRRGAMAAKVKADGLLVVEDDL